MRDHGAARTPLLVRLAHALGVALRHYNASTQQFDDLTGFPIPDSATAGDLVAFFYEIGRCRPGLLPLIHEKRITVPYYLAAKNALLKALAI